MPMSQLFKVLIPLKMLVQCPCICYWGYIEDLRPKNLKVWKFAVIHVKFYHSLAHTPFICFSLIQNFMRPITSQRNTPEDEYEALNGLEATMMRNEGSQQEVRGIQCLLVLHLVTCFLQPQNKFSMPINEFENHYHHLDQWDSLGLLNAGSNPLPQIFNPLQPVFEPYFLKFLLVCPQVHTWNIICPFWLLCLLNSLRVSCSGVERLKLS